MSDKKQQSLNNKINRLVWFDIPVKDLSRAAEFYQQVLLIKVEIQNYNGIQFAVLEHEEGNGGCLVPQEKEISATLGPLIYLNVEGRLVQAIAKAISLKGQLIQDIHQIGPYGYRALIIDCEGNRIALHSSTNT